MEHTWVIVSTVFFEVVDFLLICDRIAFTTFYAMGLHLLLCASVVSGVVQLIHRCLSNNTRYLALCVGFLWTCVTD